MTGTPHRKLPWGVGWTRLDGPPGLALEIGPLLPEQTACPLAGAIMGEKRLYAAVLAEAIRALRAPRVSRVYEEAETYLFGEPQGELLPFVHVCHTLGINPTWLRKQLRSRLAQVA